MIFDTLNNLPNYLGMSSNLDAAIEYIMARDITTLAEGRTRISGDDVAVEVRTMTPQPGEKVDFACRENTLTLVTDLVGSEMFEVSLGISRSRSRPMEMRRPMAALPPVPPACCRRGGSPCSWPESPIKWASRPRAAARSSRLCS